MREVRVQLCGEDWWDIYPLGKVVRTCLKQCGKEMTRWCWDNFEELLESDCSSLYVTLQGNYGEPGFSIPGVRITKGEPCASYNTTRSSD